MQYQVKLDHLDLITIDLGERGSRVIKRRNDACVVQRTSYEFFVCCSVMPCSATRCSVLQCVAVCCSVLQCVEVYCSVLPCFARTRLIRSVHDSFIA